MSRLPAAAAVTVVVAAAGYEGALALGWRSTRTLSDRPDEWIVPVVAFGALVLLAVLVATRAAIPESVLALAAASALLLARFHSFDPYYVPTLRRMSDGGVVGAAWVYGLIAAGGASAGLLFVHRRPGRLSGAVVLLLIARTVELADTGH